MERQQGHECKCHTCTNWVRFDDERYCFSCEPPFRNCSCGCGCRD